MQRTLLLNRAARRSLRPAARARRSGCCRRASCSATASFCGRARASRVRDDLHLHFVAFDLARAADGRWWVVSDRTQAPSGAGYALENRVVSSQCLPELFAERNVRRLASFFRAFFRAVLEPLGSRPAASGVLVAGPVEAELLRARVPRSLLGLQRRRGLRPHGARRSRVLEDGRGPEARRSRSCAASAPSSATRSSCARTRLSVCRACVQAARAGKVTIGNALGSGSRRERLVLELPAELWPPFLDEELAMPSLATWWCGQERERGYVLEHLDELVVRRVRSVARSVPARPGRLVLARDARRGARSVDSRDRAQRPRVHRPGAHRVVAGADLVRTRTRCAPRRCCCASTSRRPSKGYEVMPGGLTRVADGTDPQRAVARDRRRQQRHVGAVRSARRAIQPAGATPSEPALAPRRPRFAEPQRPTTCSGSAATRSAPKAPCGCCAAS